jgi:L-rhamnose isomerase
VTDTETRAAEILRQTNEESARVHAENCALKKRVAELEQANDRLTRENALLDAHQTDLRTLLELARRAGNL